MGESDFILFVFHFPSFATKSFNFGSSSSSWLNCALSSIPFLSFGLGSVVFKCNKAWGIILGICESVLCIPLQNYSNEIYLDNTIKRITKMHIFLFLYDLLSYSCVCMLFNSRVFTQNSFLTINCNSIWFFFLFSKETSAVLLILLTTTISLQVIEMIKTSWNIYIYIYWNLSKKEI